MKKLRGPKRNVVKIDHSIPNSNCRYLRLECGHVVPRLIKRRRRAMPDLSGETHKRSTKDQAPSWVYCECCLYWPNE